MAVDVTLNIISSGYNLAKINENFVAIDTALQDAVSLSGNTPNSMSADLDMNSQQLLNLLDPTLAQHAVTKAYGDANYGGTAVILAEAAQAAAEAAQVAAETAQTGAETAETNAGVSETNAATSETNAAASAAAAAASAAEGLYRDVVVLTFADSPYTILSASDGDFFKVDTSGGAVTVNLPDLSLEINDFRCAIMKETVDVNAVTVNRQGTDTINGGTTISVISQYETTNFIGDQSTLEWSATDATTGSSLLIANNLSDVASAATSRTNLGVAIGSDVQAWSTDLDNVSGTNTGDEVAATITVAGIVEKSTSAENVAGTSDVVYPTVAGTKEMIDTHSGGAGIGDYITSKTVSGAAELTFEDGDSAAAFDGTYKKLWFIIEDLYPATTNQAIKAEISIAGTYLQANYAWNNHGATAATPGTGGSSSDVNIQFTNIGLSNAAASASSGNLYICDPADTAVYKLVTGDLFGENNTGHYQVSFMGKYEGATGAVDGIRIFPTTGNISLTVHVYGIKAV